ncbi:MAG: DNA polymerase Y family protein, partial [Sphingomonadales bacterium]|nr:DNA polymerase Y family protein [Sphingomonadales bacterium]
MPDAPLALVARQQNAMRIAATDAAAQALGLVPGQALADARAAVPDLLAVAHDPSGDARWLERLGRECRGWTPAVELAPPDALVLDIAGCDHLAGGEDGLRAAVLDAMAARGMNARPGCGGTAAAALALA